MPVRHLLFLCIAVLALSARGQSTPRPEISFDGVLTIDALWSLDQAGFQKASPRLPFQWTSDAKDSARAAGYQGMTLFGRRIYEFVVRFEQNKVAVITANFYARGDAGEISEAAFEALRQSTIDTLTKVLGSKPTVRGKDATSAVRAEGLVWNTQKSHYLLEYSFTREIKSRGQPFRAEFVRLEVRPVQEKQSFMAAALGSKKAKFSGPAHVKRDTATGDVWLADIPMVDQGDKGYCVVASAERVMRYYGTDVDANELAQIANSDSAGGTSVRAIRDSMKKLAARLKIRVRQHESLEVRELLDMVKDYNRVAKRAGEAEIPDPETFYDIGDIYDHMKGPVLTEARARNKTGLGRFQREVQGYIDAGIPLLWSVQLGIIPEPGIPQSAGGHMRLIVGYNTKTQEIIFSDSWGAGHERKRMKTDAAWAITTGLMTVEPLS
jgi:hypothetical protein